MRQKFLPVLLWILSTGAMWADASLTVDWTVTDKTKVGTNFTLNVNVDSAGLCSLSSVENVPPTIAFAVSGTVGIPALYGKTFSLNILSVNGQNFSTHNSIHLGRMGIAGWRFKDPESVARITADLSQLSSNLTVRLTSVEILNSSSDYTIGLRDSSGIEAVGAPGQSQLAGFSPVLSGGGTDFFEYRAVSGNAGGWGSLTFDFGMKDVYETPIQLANIFSSGCVLQRDHTVPVWGTCEPGEAICVTVHEQVKSCVADDAGNWRVVLDAEPASGPFAMTISGERSTAVVLSDVYFGDVWLLTGQSNMFLALKSHLKSFADYYPEIPNAQDDFDDMRFMLVDTVEAPAPAKDITVKQPWSRWQADKLQSMSTLGYFIARQLNDMLDTNGQENIPLGFIRVCRGATAAEQWMSAESLAAMDEPLIADEGKPASGFYNGMIAPLQNYAIKGMLWYQGSGNARTIERSEQYPVVWRTLVESWREQWGINFPMYYVQLSTHMKYSPIPKDDDPSARYANLAWIRESQTACRAVPNTEMACIIDIGFQGHAHAPGKDRVGQRVARIMAAKTYGIDTVYRGPNVSNVRFEGSDVVITFDHVAGGLETRAVDAQPDDEEIAEGMPPVSVSADELAGFALCGSDRGFYWATDAEIVSSNQVRVSNVVDVPQPVALRYAWQSYPRCNLFNSEGLPAEPFRTDNYEYLSSGGGEASK
ncbi:MAG: sialate O-acetylesterase [Kiritimatiellales bacterium]|nr:sialate O-acetylesterase [Kiritimatiellales bacterium]